MALAGTGAVAIWHEIAPEGRKAFYAWHGSEHMPERLGVPGFLRGRRYVAVHGTPEFFNLYETATADVVKGDDYLARLNAPTPWTVSTVRHFRGVARSLCEVVASAGEGQGGLVATFRYDVDDADAAAHRARMMGAVARLASEEGIAGCHLLVADAAASAVETAEKRARGEGTEVPRWILLVESWDDTADFVAWCERLAGRDLFVDASVAPSWAGYQLQNARDRLGAR